MRRTNGPSELAGLTDLITEDVCMRSASRQSGQTNEPSSFQWTKPQMQQTPAVRFISLVTHSMRVQLISGPASALLTVRCSLRIAPCTALLTVLSHVRRRCLEDPQMLLALSNMRIQHCMSE